MRYLTTAAMALALAASAAVASADPQSDHQNDNGGHASGRGSHDAGGQGAHGGPQGGAAGAHAAVQAPVHPVGQFAPAGGQPGAHAFTGQPSATFHGNGQAGGAGAQTYRGYGRGPGGYVAPTGPGAPNGQVDQFHRGAGAGNGFQGDQAGQFHGDRRDWNGQGGHDRGGNGNWNGQGGQFHGGAGFAGGQHGGVPGGDHALRGRDQGRGWFNPDRFPQQFHAERRFHDRWDHRPEGWYERTWAFGDFLPFGWFAQDYYLDFQDYGLPYPPVGCEWVREGSDAVLVDIWTGEVLSVAYGVFW